MDIEKIIAIGLCSLIAIGIILATTFNHIETKTFIANGYCQEQRIASTSMYWVKCK